MGTVVFWFNVVFWHALPQCRYDVTSFPVSGTHRPGDDGNWTSIKPGNNSHHAKCIYHMFSAWHVLNVLQMHVVFVLNLWKWVNKCVIGNLSYMWWRWLPVYNSTACIFVPEFMSGFLPLLSCYLSLLYLLILFFCFMCQQRQNTVMRLFYRTATTFPERKRNPRRFPEKLRTIGKYIRLVCVSARFEVPLSRPAGLGSVFWSHQSTVPRVHC